MADTRFHLDTSLPFSWETAAAPPAAAMQLGARLLLNAINQMEATTGHTDRGDPSMERLEAKLDLMLHWLGQSLQAGKPLPEAVALRLDAEGVAWSAGVVPNLGTRVTLRLYPHPALAGALELPGRVTEAAGGQVRVEFLEMDEALRDLWSQWLFRRHRRAIHAAREGG
jgi:hypothetical protein